MPGTEAKLLFSLNVYFKTESEEVDINPSSNIEIIFFCSCTILIKSSSFVLKGKMTTHFFVFKEAPEKIFHTAS